MDRLVAAVRHGVADHNWYAALGLALALPDICGFLDSPSSGSQQRYVTWCDQFLVPKYTRQVGARHITHTFLSGEDCYALRCAFLHEGSDEITRQRARNALDSFHFVSPPARGGSFHCNQVNNNLQLQVDTFCEDMCHGVEAWLQSAGTRPDVRPRLGELLVVHDSSTGLSI